MEFAIQLESARLNSMLLLQSAGLQLGIVTLQTPVLVLLLPALMQRKLMEAPALEENAS